MSSTTSQPFIHDDFMLQSQAARELYHNFAKDEPILDFHNHLPPDEIAADRSFETLFDIWLAGDHYKWRAMRANGITEDRITGNASPRDKFDAWSETVPHCLRNALYHWTHLELSRYFGFEGLFSPATADEVWEKGNAALAKPEYSCRGLLKSSKVRALCTTDDPTHTLEHHKAIAEDDSIDVGVYPTFRPDPALWVDDAEHFNTYADKLSEISGVDCSTLAGYKDALRARHDFFHSLGGRLSDHGLHHIFDAECSDEKAAAIFDKVRTGSSADAAETEAFGAYLMLFIGELNAARGWTMQLHIGAERNNNPKLFETLGRDVGCDSMADVDHAGALRRFLSTLNLRGHLPKVMVYNLNPKDNYALATMIGNFQFTGEGVPKSPLQLGTAWWFMDTKEGMEWQINTFSNTSLLSHFNGMLTDSRSFLSFTRHEYFRRILCNVIGEDIEKGEIPREMEMVGEMVRRICFQNAADFFGLEVS
ncbi:MAG: glucuronate isomerase [Verrucomicrobiales bacterium]|nr:glucuronate isomerase [Verrucomicrobiales bacterium]